MGRLVRKPKRASSDLGIAGLEEVLPPGLGDIAGQQQPAQAADNYLERIAKYVPAEVIAFTIFVNAILEQVLRSGGPTATMAGLPVSTVALGALAVGFVLTPLFVWYVREEGDAWVINAFVSTLAFPFWAYALGAAAFNTYWDGNLAAILLATFTIISGLISPRSPKPKRREKVQQTPPPRTERPHLDLIEPSPA
jgi:hypothetical protein